MGLNLNRMVYAGRRSSLALAALLAVGAAPVLAQPSPPAGTQGGGGTGTTYAYNQVQNAYLTLFVGSGSAVAGSLGIWTNIGNQTDPFNPVMYGGPLQPSDSPVPVPYFGGWLFIRIDDGTKGTLKGKDYIFGDPGSGSWQVAPQVVGNHIEAQWVTKPFSSGTGSSGTTGTDVVEVDLVGSFIHDTVRFSFTAKNRTGNANHKIGMAFVEDIGVKVNTYDLDGPLRLTGAPYLHNESLLTGGQIPSMFTTYTSISPATATTPATFHTIKAILQPTSSVAKEPTPPTRFAYGRTSLLQGSDYSSGTKTRNFEWTWSFDKYMDPTVVLDKNVGLNSTDATTVVYWDQELVASGGSITKVAYIGSDTATTDYTGPATLSVSGPPALGFITDRTIPTAPVATAAPNPFTISAYVQNLTDLNTAGNQFSFNVVNFTLDLPAGLKLAPGETNLKQATNVSPGGEASVSWNVVLDSSNPKSGTLNYAVSAQADTLAKVVQRSIQIPAPTTVTLDPDVLHPGYFKMRSFGLLFGSATPSQVLGLPNGTGVTPQIDTRQWDPTAGRYVEQPSWTPGSSYWVKYSPLDPSITTPKTFSVNAALYPPLDSQIQPNASSYRVHYPRGWNMIGNPYVYDYRFSELQVFNTSTLSVTDIISASNNVNRWLLPAVYHYNTTDPNPANWYYELEPNLGFTMQAGEGYWIYVLQDNLQFIFNGVDTPGGSVSRSAQVGVGLGTTLGKNQVNNWRLNLVAKSAHGTDTLAYIGVAPSATDGQDSFKYNKPPTFNPGTSLDIVHQDWGTANGRYAQDLRSANLTNKTWNLQVSAPANDKEVTITWPGIAASVPSNYDLILLDPQSNIQHSLRDMSSYTVAVTPGTTRALQIVAKPRSVRMAAAITSFDVVSNSTRANGNVGSVTIRYTLSNVADTMVNIRDGRGRTVRTISAPTRAAADASGASVGELVWDLKDQRGVTLTTGTYQAEIVAVSNGGQRSRQVKPFTIAR